MLLHIIELNDKASSGAILYNSEYHEVLVIMYLMIFVHRAVLKIKHDFWGRDL
jgi:hypothetical protein